MKRIQLFIAVIAAAAAFGGEPAAKTTQLELSDGRVLENPVVIGQSALRITVKHAGGLAQVDKALLPADWKVRYPEDAEAAKREAAKDAHTLAIQEQLIAAKRKAQEADLKRREREADSRSDRSDSSDRATSDVQRQAEAAVQRYFKTQYFTGNAAKYLTDVDVQVTDVEPVQGWDGRWNIKGSAWVEFFQSPGSSFQSQRRTFTGQYNSKGRYGEIDITVR